MSVKWDPDADRMWRRFETDLWTKAPEPERSAQRKARAWLLAVLVGLLMWALIVGATVALWKVLS